MTYFGHFNFWLLFLNLKLRYPGIWKNQETYVAGGGGGAANFYFFENSPSPICAKIVFSAVFLSFQAKKLKFTI